MKWFPLLLLALVSLFGLSLAMALAGLVLLIESQPSHFREGRAECLAIIWIAPPSSEVAFGQAPGTYEAKNEYA